MKKTLFLLLFITTVSSAQAGFGVEAGIAKTGFASLSTHQGADVLSPFFNVYTDVQIDRILYITAQTGYSKRGGNFSPLMSYVPPANFTPKIIKAEYSLDYIDFSLLLKARLTPPEAHLMFTLFAGPTINYFVGGNVKLSYAGNTPGVKKDADGISTVGIGATFGAGLGVHAPGGLIEFRTVIFTQFTSSVESNTGLDLGNISQGLSITWHLEL